MLTFGIIGFLWPMALFLSQPIVMISSVNFCNQLRVICCRNNRVFQTFCMYLFKKMLQASISVLEIFLNPIFSFIDPFWGPDPRVVPEDNMASYTDEVNHLL